MLIKTCKSHKCLKFSFLVLCCVTVALLNIIYYTHLESLQTYKLRFTKAYEYCEKNPHSTPRKGTTLIKGYKSYPCNKDLYVKKCKSCAYVTSSGHLIDSKVGKEIDQHDCVFRSNCAPINGYTEDVGKRTTFRTMNHLSVRDMLSMLEKDGLEGFDYNAPNNTIFLGYQVTWHGEEPEIIKLLPDWPNMTFYITENWKIDELQDVFHKEIGPTGFTLWMTNGFVSLQLMRDFCEETHVYGIADENHCDKVKQKVEGYVDHPYHYYGYLEMLETECWRFWRHGNGYWGHQYIKEKALFHRWMREWKNLYFHQPEWEP